MNVILLVYAFSPTSHQRRLTLRRTVPPHTHPPKNPPKRITWWWAIQNKFRTLICESPSWKDLIDHIILHPNEDMEATLHALDTLSLNDKRNAEDDYGKSHPQSVSRYSTAQTPFDT
jgi:hypothetical protein